MFLQRGEKQFMKIFFTLLIKEFYNFFHSVLFYICLLLNVLFAFLFKNFTLINSLIPFISVLIIPLLTMNLWTEEKNISECLPLSDLSLIISKIFSTLLLFILINFPFIILSFINNIESAVILSSMLILFFYAASAISLSVFINLFSKNKALSFLLSFIILLCFSIINKVSVLLNAGIYLQKFFNFFSFSWRFDAGSKGIIDSSDIIYFILLTVINILFSLIIKNKQKNGRKTDLHLPVITCLLLLLLFSSIRFRKDITKNKIYSLSDETITILSSIHEPVHVSWYTSKNLKLLSPSINDIQNMLLLFSENKNIILEKVIYDKNNSAKNILKSFNVHPVNIENYSDIISAILVEYKDKTEIIPLILSSDNLEFIFASILKKFSQNQTLNCQILSGTNLKVTDDYPYLENAFNAYGINSLVLNNASELYENVPLLLLGCTSLTDNDCSLIDIFIQNGNNAMFAVSSYDIDINKNWTIKTSYNNSFFNLLSQYGIYTDSSIIYDNQCVNISLTNDSLEINSKVNIKYPFWLTNKAEIIYKDTVNFFWPINLKCDDNYKVFFHSSDESYLISDGKQLEYSSPFEIEKIIPDKTNQRRYNVVIEKELVNNSRIIVAGDYLFCSKLLDYTNNLNNLDFLVNCILELNYCEDLVTIRNKKKAS